MIARYVNQGYWKPEQAAEYEGQGIPDDAGLEGLYITANGVEYLSEKRAKELAAKKAEQDLIASQQKTSGTEPIQPYQRAQLDQPTAEQRTFESSYLLGWLQEHGVTKPTAKDIKNAFEDYRKSLAPRIQVPGVDVPLPTNVAAQRVDIAGQTAAAQTAARPPANQAVLKSKTLELKNLEDAVNSYQKELEVTGPTFLPGKGAKLKTQFTNLQMLTKSLFALGVITGPDMQILEGAITDPTGPKGNFLGTKALLEQLEVMKAVVKRSKANLEEVYGTGGTTPPGGPPDDATHEYNPTTGKIEAIRR
jgi:hypothetical protein